MRGTPTSARRRRPTCRWMTASFLRNNVFTHDPSPCPFSFLCLPIYPCPRYKPNEGYPKIRPSAETDLPLDGGFSFDVDLKTFGPVTTTKVQFQVRDKD